MNKVNQMLHFVQNGKTLLIMSDGKYTWKMSIIVIFMLGFINDLAVVNRR